MIRPRAAYASLALIVVGLCLGSILMFAASKRMSGHLSERIEQAYGASISSHGRQTISFDPFPTAVLENVHLTSTVGMAVSNATMRGSLKLWPLLSGQVELTDVSLEGGQISIRSEDGKTIWSQAAREQSQSGQDTELPLTLFIRGSAIDIAIEDLPAILLSEAHLSTYWNRGSDTVEIAGTALWQGRTISLGRLMFHPEARSTGTARSFAISMTTGSEELVADGNITESGNVNGSLSFMSKSLADFGRWTGLRLPLDWGWPTASIEGGFTLDGQNLTLPKVMAKLGADTFDGTLTLFLNHKRLAISATLATDTLNLSPYFTQAGKLWTPLNLIEAEPLSLQGTTGSDLDLRISASRTQLGPFQLTDLAGNVLVRQGRIEAALARANTARGVIKGKLTVSDLTQTQGASSAQANSSDVSNARACIPPDQSLPDEGQFPICSKGIGIRYSGNFEKIDWALLFEQIGKPNWISGTGHGQWLLEAEGRTVAQLWRHLTGNASASITDGEITGVDLTRALEQKTLVPGQDQNGGKTPFSNLQSTLTANGDTITLSDGIMTTEAAKAGFSGTLSLFRQALMLRGSIVTGKDPVRVLTFAIDGPWRKPLFSFENLASSPPATVETPPAVP